MDDEFLRAELQQIREQLKRAFDFIEKLASDRTASTNNRLVAQSIRQVVVSVNDLKVQLLEVIERLETEGVLRRTESRLQSAETQLIIESTKSVQKAAEEISQQHHLADIHEAAGEPRPSKPPAGGAGVVYQIRKVIVNFAGFPRVTQLLILILLIVIGGTAFIVSKALGPRSTDTSERSE